MFMSNPKKRAAVIVASIHPSDDAEQHDMSAEHDDAHAGHEAAAEEIMSAIHSKDSKGLAEALKSFYDMCEADEGSPEEEASESPEEESSEQDEHKY